MSIDKKAAIKLLWSACTDLVKTIKELSENQVISSEAIESLWRDFERNKELLKVIYKINPGNFYKQTDYNNKYIIFRMENFNTGADGLCANIRILTSTKEEHSYEKVTDIMSVVDMTSWKEIKINPDEFPLYVSNCFNGTLYKELMEKSKERIIS